MDAKTMWEQYASQHGIVATFDAWCFGDDADALAQLVLDGKKTATSSAYSLYALEGDEFPEEGQYSVILWSDETAACIIKTTKVSVVPFCDVSSDHAFQEGEGDRSLAYWRKVHHRFFAEELESLGLVFTDSMQVVCEEFVCLYP